MAVELLSRMQFGFSIGFHILFPTLNLGLAIFLVIMEGLWLKTKEPIYLEICKFWTKIFALTFGMGVVSGIVLAYQIGTNFGPFITQFGNVLGALFGSRLFRCDVIWMAAGSQITTLYSNLAGNHWYNYFSVLDYVR